MRSSRDLVIVGAGPSGLFAAHHLSRTMPKLKILVLERGTKGAFGGNRPHTCPVDTEGLGGSGNYSDKLYFERAGGFLEDRRSEDVEPFISHVAEIFERFGGFSERDAFALGRTKPQIPGLDFKPYKKLVPLRYADYRTFLRNMVNELIRNGVDIRFRKSVESIIHKSSSFSLQLQDGSSLRSNNVLVATGRSSATWIRRQAKMLGLRLGASKPWIGIRVETDAAFLKKLSGWSRDPKIKLPSPGSNSVTKTHCVCFNGHVISCRCDGMILVDGTSLEVPSSNTSLNVITRIVGVTSYDRCRRIVDEMKARGEGRPLVQKMGDFMKGIPTSPEKLNGNSVKPSLKSITPGEVSQQFPTEVTKNIIDFLELMQGKFPGMTRPDNLIYAPVFEWFSPKVQMNMTTAETSVPGLYVTGDAASLSQGVVMAAASGLWSGLKLEKLL
ncbi:MAG: NAD(P)-binding protein [Thaumarchaeota archaeon]|nr:NAD(P)-binding protein [Nitrososphaerota archaeon]